MIQLRKDVQKLQQTNDMNHSRVNQLEEENEALRGRLRSVVQSPLSDNEKQQMLQDSQSRMHSSAPASIALTNVRLIHLDYLQLLLILILLLVQFKSR